jgi:septal ring factor EnvC (AmiA/AmiB activator)
VGEVTVTRPVSAERARLARDIAKIEKGLDHAMNMLGRTQRALVEAGAGIAGMHEALHSLKKAVDDRQQPDDATE